MPSSSFEDIRKGSVCNGWHIFHDTVNRVRCIRLSVYYEPGAFEGKIDVSCINTRVQTEISTLQSVPNPPQETYNQ